MNRVIVSYLWIPARYDMSFYSTVSAEHNNEKPCLHILTGEPEHTDHIQYNLVRRIGCNNDCVLVIMLWFATFGESS